MNHKNKTYICKPKSISYMIIQKYKCHVEINFFSVPQKLWRFTCMPGWHLKLYSQIFLHLNWILGQPKITFDKDCSSLYWFSSCVRVSKKKKKKKDPPQKGPKKDPPHSMDLDKFCKAPVLLLKLVLQFSTEQYVNKSP